MKFAFLESRAWKFFCSLKLAIILASAAVLLTLGGSLLMPFNPKLFGSLDSMPLDQWLETVAGQAPALTWWLPAAGGLVVLLGCNTLCCLIDWLCHFRARWRKIGEYLIHLGLVLVLGAYLWGSQAGFRNPNVPLLVGQSKSLPRLDMVLRLEAFEPLLNDRGRPIDMRNSLALFRNGELLERVDIRTNHPLTRHGLVVLPASFGQTVRAGQPVYYSVLTINYDPGANLAFAGSLAMGCGVLLTLVSFYRKRARGDRPEVI